MTEDGSEALRPRLERFAQLLASPEKRTATECWCLSDPSPTKPEPTPGRQVAASRNANRSEVMARVAYLRAERAQVLDSELDQESVSKIMASVTERFLRISEMAEQMGLSELAQKLRRMTIIHSGRSARLHRFAPEMEERGRGIDANAALDRLPICQCE